MIYDRATRMGRSEESQRLVTDRESVSFPSQLLACLSLELRADQTRQMLGMYCLAERESASETLTETKRAEWGAEGADLPESVPLTHDHTSKTLQDTQNK